MLGHSIGEYVAAHLAGVMSLEDSLALLQRADVLCRQLPPGRMAAVHCAPEKLRSLIREGVEIAAINAPELCTVSGPSGGRRRAVETVGSKQDRVSTASHLACLSFGHDGACTRTIYRRR